MSLVSFGYQSGGLDALERIKIEIEEKIEFAYRMVYLIDLRNSYH